MVKIIGEVGEITSQRLRRLKENQGYADKTWGEWLTKLAEGTPLETSASSRIKHATVSHLAPLWMENFILNVPKMINPTTFPKTKEDSSIGLLPKHPNEPAIVVGAGPSVEEHKHLELLAKSNFKGILLLTDRMTIPALKKGVTPNKFPKYFSCSVDGNREKIVKWFDDPLLDEHGPKITMLFASTGAPNAVDRCIKAGCKIQWFHGMLDSFAELDSVTSFMNYMTGSTVVNCLGNTGGACWTIANYLECNPIILVGLNYGYTPDTPLEQTAYYEVYKECGLTPEAMESMYSRGHNPLFNTDYSIDVVYQYYKEAFLSALELSRAETWNATEGGSLHGGRLTGMRFEEALKKLGAL